MTNTAIRAQLHKYIDATDDVKIEALYTILKDDMEQGYLYTEGEMSILHERAQEHLKGGGKTYTVEESHSKITGQKSK